MSGRELYEASLISAPNYCSGNVRPTWDKLPGFYKAQWDRAAWIKDAEKREELRNEIANQGDC